MNARVIRSYLLVVACVVVACVAWASFARAGSAALEPWPPGYTPLPNAWTPLPWANVQLPEPGPCYPHGGVVYVLLGVDERGAKVYWYSCVDGTILPWYEDAPCNGCGPADPPPPGGPYNDDRGDEAPGAQASGECDANSEYGCGY